MRADNSCFWLYGYSYAVVQTRAEWILQIPLGDTGGVFRLLHHAVGDTLLRPLSTQPLLFKVHRKDGIVIPMISSSSCSTHTPPTNQTPRPS